MDNQLFRQKSLDRISSPEELHDYMRVTSPRLWMILGAILVLLAGFIVFASTATMENALPIKVDAMNIGPVDTETGSSPLCVFTTDLPAGYQGVITPGMTVRLGDKTGKTDFISLHSEGDTQSLSVVIEMDDPAFYLPDGSYDGELVLESVTPVSFLWN